MTNTQGGEMPVGPVTDRAAAANAAGAVPTDYLGVAHLWASQFQHLTTLGTAGAGGVFILLQSGVFTTQERWWLSVACFVATSALGIMGQIAVVDDATAGRVPGRHARRLRAAAMAFLGAAAGAAFSITR